MDEPRIQNGVPLPDRPKGRPRGKRWAFLDTMEAGQSATWDEFSSEEEKRRFRKSLGSIISNRYPKSADKEFAVRSIGPPEFDKEGVGVWRVR